ncbi:MAG: M48 family metallopeptidase [Bacteroidales bacterium]
MKKLFIILFLGLWSIAGLKGQSSNFSTLSASGDIPNDFLTGSQHDFSQAMRESNRSADRRRTASLKEDYLARSNWQINRMLRNGSVIFNDSITEYVSEVADHLLRNDPDLRDELRFYTAKHSAVNAFSTDAGVILFSTGLIAQLENEAQLGFVIAHEIIHYLERHGITGYVEEQLVNQELDDYDSWMMDEKLYLAKNNRSREMETEADEKGFEMFFAKSDYELEAALGVMDVLQYAYLPFNEIEFSPAIFTNQYFTVPEEFLLEKVNIISVGDDYDDTRSTHPSVRKRRDNLRDMIRLENKSKQGKEFIVSEKRFERVKKLARYETVRQHILNRDFARAVYDAHVMLQENPNDPFLKEVVAGALYGLSVYKSDGDEEAGLSDYEDIEGELQQVYFLMHEMSSEWANVIATQYAWHLHKQDPDNKYLSKIIDHLLLNLISEENMELKDFYNESKEQLLAQEDSLKMAEQEIEEGEEGSKSKYERIRARSKQSHLERGEEEYRFAFVEMLNDQDFKEAFKKADERARELAEKDEITYADLKREAEQEKAQKEKQKTGFKIGVDRTFIIEPYFVSMDTRQDEPVQFFKSEERQRELSHSIQWSSRQVGLDGIMMDSWQLSRHDVKQYNEIMLLKEWMAEYFNHDDLHIVPFASRDVYPLMEKYDTRYMNWMGMANGRVKDEGKIMRGCMYFYIGLVPLAIYEWVKPSYEMILFNLLIDLEAADIRFSYRYGVEKKGGTLRMKQRVYDVINQIATEE